MHLPQSGRADRLAVGQAAAVGVDRQPTGRARSHRGRAASAGRRVRTGRSRPCGRSRRRNPCPAAARPARPSGRCRMRRTRPAAASTLGLWPASGGNHGREHLERAEPPGPLGHRRKVDRTIAHVRGPIASREHDRSGALSRGAQHVLRQRRVDDPGRQDLLLGERRAPPGRRVEFAAAEGFGRHLCEQRGP